jgi:hypothetical protein
VAVYSDPGIAGVAFAPLSDGLPGPPVCGTPRRPAGAGPPRPRAALEALLTTLRLQAPACAEAGPDGLARRRGSCSSAGSAGSGARVAGLPVPLAGAPGSGKALAAAAATAAAADQGPPADGSPALPRTPHARPPPRPAPARGSPTKQAFAATSPRAPVGVVATRWRSGEPVTLSPGPTPTALSPVTPPARGARGAAAAAKAAAAALAARAAARKLRSFHLADFPLEDSEDC